MQDELKACPFCGDRGPEITGHYMSPPSIYIACTAGSDCTATGPAHHTEAEAIAAWNTRADPALAAAQAEVARYRCALEQIASGNGIGGPDAEVQCAQVARAALVQP